MLHIVKTFNGHTLNDTDYQTQLLNPHGVPDAQPVFIDAANADSIDAGVYAVNVQAKVLSITIKDYANRYALIAQLKQWFKRGTSGSLVVTFLDDSTDYQMSARVISLVQDDLGDGMHWTINLQTGNTSWRAVTADTYTWNLTGTGGTYALDLDGDDETPLSATISLSVSPGIGYPYQKLYQLLNAPQTVPPIGYGPWCITMDTATLVTGGKMLASCNDLRVYVNGQEVPRWISSPNNANTKVWFNVTVHKGYSLAIRTAMDNSTNYAYIEFALTADTLAAIAAMPSEGILVHGTEWIKYRKLTYRYKLQIIQRGVLNTTKQAHIVGDVFRYMENVITVVYGNPSAVDPATENANYDDTKPCFSLSSSSNTSWVYTASDVFWDINGTGRTGGFTPAILTRLGPETEYYSIKQNAASGDPAMGMKMGAFQVAGGWNAERAKVCWNMYRGCGINTTTFTGEKYRNSTSFPTIVVGLQKSDNGSTYAIVWTEGSPASVSTWTALSTHSGVSMGNSRWMRIMFNGAITATASAYAAFDILTGTVAWVSANLPAGTLGSEKVAAQVNFTLTNAANGDSFDALYPALIGLSLAMDAEAKTILYNNVNAHDAITLDDEGRSNWIRLQKGTNNLTISSDDVGTMQVVLSWYKRRL